MYAAWNDHAQAVLYLLARGALVHLGDRTALMLAASCGHFQILKILLTSHPDLEDNVKDEKGYNGLFYATYFGHYESCRMLLELGSNPNVLEISRQLTPLLLAVEQGHERIVELLLQHGADLDYVSPQGSTVISIAKETGNERLYVFFLKLQQSSNVVLPPLLPVPPSKNRSKINAILAQLNLEKYGSHFQNVDFDTFVKLSETDLRELGITLVGPRRKLTSAISKLQLGQTI